MPYITVTRQSSSIEPHRTQEIWKFGMEPGDQDGPVLFEYTKKIEKRVVSHWAGYPIPGKDCEEHAVPPMTPDVLEESRQRFIELGILEAWVPVSANSK